MAGSSSQSSSNQSYVDPVQQRYNADLYSKAQGLQESQVDMGSIARNKLDEYLPGMKQAFQEDILKSDFSNSVANQDNLSMQTLADMQQSGPNPYLESMYNAAARQVNNNLTRNILPAIRGGAVAAGQSGSSREGIAQGLAMSDANLQASDLAAQMYGGAYDADQGRRLSAAGAYGGLGLQGEAQRANQGANKIAMGQQLYNTELDPYQKAWDPLRNYKSIVGNAVVLGEGSSSGSSWNIL